MNEQTPKSVIGAWNQDADQVRWVAAGLMAAGAQLRRQARTSAARFKPSNMWHEPSSHAASVYGEAADLFYQRAVELICGLPDEPQTPPPSDVVVGEEKEDGSSNASRAAQGTDSLAAPEAEPSAAGEG